jgi:hypothetical protein
MNDLVERLSNGRHAVEASLRPERSVKALKECLDRGWVHVRFTGTRGGTELGFPVDAALTQLADADLEQERGRVKLVGALTLDYVKVRCVAELDLPSLEGQGWLERVLE